MSKDLKTYSFNDPYDGYRDKDILKEKSDEKIVTESDVKDAIAHFSKMDNNQLMMELAKQIGMQKEKGNQTHIKETIERIKPFLNEEQKQRLEEIIKRFDI